MCSEAGKLAIILEPSIPKHTTLLTFYGRSENEIHLFFSCCVANITMLPVAEVQIRKNLTFLSHELVTLN